MNNENRIKTVALSIQQPWAWLIVNGYKDVENRSWPTRRTGLFYIHAGKKFDHQGYANVLLKFPQIKMPSKDDFEFGGIVGCAQLYDCVDASDSEWFMGEWGFLLRNARTVPFEPLRGKLGFFAFDTREENAT